MAKRGIALGASISALLAAAASPAVAQQAAPAAPEERTEEVVITGSFIKGTPEDAALPVDVVTMKDLENRGSPTVTQLIKTIPSSGAVIGENNRFGGGNGASTINLRNLNSATTGARTLVLFNGKRVATGTRGLGSVDLNLLPVGVVGRLEVLKDGAAATYGSDAIAGVVNLITRRDIRGFEANANYQFIDGSDGDYTGNIAYGFGTDNADGLFALGVAQRSQMSVKERSWALRQGPTGYLQNPLGGWASTGNPGLYLAPSAAPAGNANTGFTSTSALFTQNLPDIGCAANGGAPYSITTLASTNTAPVSTTQCQFQYTSFDNLVENEDRMQAYSQINVDLDDNLRLSLEGLWARNETPLQSWAMTGPNQWPAPILASGGSTGGGLSPISAAGTGEQSNFYIPATNPGLQQLVAQIGASSCAGPVYPWGIDAASCAAGRAVAVAAATNANLYGVATSTTSWRPNGFGGNPYTSDGHSHYTYKADTFRVGAGLKGEMPFGIDWDLGVVYQQLDYRYNLQDQSVTRLQMALRGYGSLAGAADQCTAAETSNFTTNAGNAALGCYYFNPFSNGWANSTSTGANPYYVASNGGIANFDVTQANRAGVVDWFEEEQYNENSERMLEVDFVTTGELPFSIGGADNVSWAAGVQGRYDRTTQNPDTLYDSSATPCVDSPPFGDGAPFCPTTSNGPFLFNANLRPYDVNRTIYSAFAESRLPLGDKLEATIAARYEKYQGFGDTFNPKLALRWQALDWLALRGSASTTYRAPRATFLTNTFSRGLSNASGTYRASDLYGNPGLDPEKAATYSLGMLFDNNKVKASVDYWNFNFKNPMTTETTTDLVGIMFPSSLPSTGHCGDPTYASLQARFGFAGACDKANILSYKTQYINGGGIKTSGVDFAVDADLFEVATGQLSAGFDGTYLLTYDEAPYLVEGFLSNAAGVQDRVGTYRASLFTGYNQIRGNVYVNYNIGEQNFRWQVRYVSGLDQVESTILGLANNTALNLASGKQVDEYYQHDFTYRLGIPSFDAQLTASVQNVLDQEPPFALGTQYNYDPGSGSPLGRVISVGLKKKF